MQTGAPRWLPKVQLPASPFGIALFYSVLRFASIFSGPPVFAWLESAYRFVASFGPAKKAKPSDVRLAPLSIFDVKVVRQ